MKELTKRSITSTVLGIVFWISIIYLPPIVFTLILASILTIIMLLEWPKFFDIHKLPFWLITPFYPLLPFALLFALNVSHDEAYRHLLFFMFVLVSSHDSGSFMIGAPYGKHKIAPSISPAKSWEGFFGGYIAAFLTIGVVILCHGKPHSSWLTIAGVTFITSVIALAGDLFESWLKRRAKLKDAGSLLPGHGGFLDRFDGVLFAIFFFYLFRDQLVIVFGA